MKKILFVSHEATFTGAPIILLHFLKWLKQKELFTFQMLLMEGGNLIDAFSAIGETLLLEPEKRTYTTRLINKLAKNKETIHPLIKQLSASRFEVVYLNTIKTVYLAPVFKAANPKCKIICHVHENEYSMHHFFSDVIKVENIDSVDHFIAVSGSTVDNLVRNLKIDPKKISLVNECISLDSIKKPQKAVDKIKTELGLTDQFVIGGSGVTTWRKGTDLFLYLALRLRNKGYENKMKLVWVGSLTKEFEDQFHYEVDRLGIKQMVILTGGKKDPQDYFQTFDVFTLTSREDPFPLVALETAALQKPTICFEGSGGIPELIQNDGQKGGYVVAYGDVEAMADAVITLYNDRQLLMKKGEMAASLVSEFDVNKIAPKILTVINRFLPLN